MTNLARVIKLYEGKEILRTAAMTDLMLDAKGWYLILTDAGWRGVKKTTGSVTFWHDDYVDCIGEAFMVEKRYCRK